MYMNANRKLLILKTKIETDQIISTVHARTITVVNDVVVGCKHRKMIITNIVNRLLRLDVTSLQFSELQKDICTLPVDIT